MTASALNELRAIDAAMVDTAPDTCAAHARDWWPQAGKWTAEELQRQLPLCVVSPDTVERVQQVVRVAQRFGLVVVPFGAGSGVCGAVCQGGGHVALDLRRLRAQIAFEPDAGSVTVQAGLPAAELEAWLAERGWTTGHYPQSLPLATVGGFVATRSSGTFSSKYGNIENLVVALEVVLPDGTLVQTHAPARAATGPDLKQLFIGAEGTLGVITAVTLRIFRMPAVRRFGGYEFGSIEAGLAAVHAAFHAHVVPAVLRLYDATEAQALYRRSGSPPGGTLLIVGHEGTAAMVEAERAEFARIAGEHAAVDLGAAIGDAWEAHRFDASWLERGNGGAAKMADAIEISARWPALGTIYHRAMARIGPLCTQAMAHWSHFYSTGGALYFIFTIEGADPADALARYQAVWDAVMEVTLQAGGSISHHHGVGCVRRDLLARELGSSAALLRTLKQALDPNDLFVRGHLQPQEGQA